MYLFFLFSTQKLNLERFKKNFVSFFNSCFWPAIFHSVLTFVPVIEQLQIQPPPGGAGGRKGLPNLWGGMLIVPLRDKNSRIWYRFGYSFSVLNYVTHSLFCITSLHALVLCFALRHSFSVLHYVTHSLFCITSLIRCFVLRHTFCFALRHSFCFVLRR